MIPYKSVLTGMKLEERNVAFNALDRETQRKEIALDALNLVLSKQVHAAEGAYWGHQLHCINEPDSKLFQDILVNKLPECDVCQRGLFMLSQIRLGNELCSDTEDVCEGNSNNVKGFDMGDFYGMESEYEGETESGDDEYLNDDNNPSEDESLPYNRHSWQKLANICCNVLSNGNFDAEDKTDFLKLWELSANQTVLSTQ